MEKANLVPDLAETGEKAVELATAHAYDVVFMDIQMPGIDGLTACSQIHETKKNPDVPVIFVTAQSDFNTRAESRLKGGADLMAKPFLVLELTVRAITFAMRKRLHVLSSSRQETIVAAPILPQPVAPVAARPTMTASCDPNTTTSSGAPEAMAATTTRTTPATIDVIPTEVAELNGDFYSEVPGYLATTRKVFEELQAAAEPAAMQDAMGTLYLRVHAIATRASLDKLSVTAHVSSTLEALLKRLYRNPKTVTTSTLNTVSSALKLLETLCVPGVEAKLAGHAPMRILVVDDEPLARRAVVGALQLAFEQPESASDGTKGSLMAAKTAYDVIFTDVQMPGLDGFELCTAIRAGTLNAQTPVVFVTNNTDVEAQARAVVCGGNDFIGKPFLPIEITVKALTFAWEGRLRNIHSAPSASLAAPDNGFEPVKAPVSPILEAIAPATPEASLSGQLATEANSVIPMGAEELAGDFFREVTQFLAVTRGIVERLQSPGAQWTHSYLQAQLDVLYLRMHTLATRAEQDKLLVASHVASTLEALLKRLQRNPKTVTASTLNTMLNALRLLDSVCVPGVEEKLADHPPIRILVVDDEPLARRAVVGALQLAFKQPESASDGTKASLMTAKTAYDVIFTDVQMPGLDGFELCSAIRAGALNAQTPVVFITNNTDVEAQAKAAASGGNDFIGKPFLPIEITVKALTFAWEGRLKKLPLAQKNTVEPVPALIAA